MKQMIIVLLGLFSFSVFGGSRVLMSTNLGDITIELHEEEAPVTTSNFLRYVNDNFYDGLIFHRVIPSFVVQGGGHKPDMTEVETRDPIINEANNGLSNLKGTIAMARTSDPHSATAQFYINVKDNTRLDYQSEEKWGYCVFGKVVDGMNVIEKIRNVRTSSRGEYNDVPVDSVVILSATIL